MSLAPARPAPAVALPVQRAAPAIPAALPAPPAAAAPPVRTPTPASVRVSAPRRATSVEVQRSSGGGGGAAERPAPSVTSRFTPRELKEDQVAELAHRLIEPMTRLLRTELRHDRERIGKLRDPRH
ncbi:hypothetical protein [Streptomyces sp. RKAG293]|uniref:hypothetical protein n=1 Tax=Streptomyces sp. RKAG293 TaxID=2893403 RepID=UPI0020341FEC|nr:hypothetical protein [Streptomyces sp. RKAG293]MCM2422387.1 hypothetical protein [Streptomyces sp. RKAG293]